MDSNDYSTKEPSGFTKPQTDGFNKDVLKNAVNHVVYNIIVYFAIILPIDLSKKAALRLAKQKKDGKLSEMINTGEWPFLSFLKTFIFEFAIDSAILISYPVGLTLLIISFNGKIQIEEVILMLYVVYSLPTLITLFGELLRITILPFKKYVDWAKKPAQHLDLDIKNK